MTNKQDNRVASVTFGLIGAIVAGLITVGVTNRSGQESEASLMQSERVGRVFGEHEAL